MSAGFEHEATLLSLYDDALPDVYRFVRGRVPTASAAEEVTGETFFAALSQIQRGALEEVTIAWLIGIARHKVADHWRRAGRRPALAAPAYDSVEPRVDDPWDAVLDSARVFETLDRLGEHHRTALTLRYLIGLPVSECAERLGRSVHATEALLVRSRRAFRTSYEGTESHD